jgi:hypothetical protein
LVPVACDRDCQLANPEVMVRLVQVDLHLFDSTSGKAIAHGSELA